MHPSTDIISTCMYVHKLTLLCMVSGARVSLGLLWARSLSSLWTISTCLHLRSTVLSLPLSCSDSGWITRAGTTGRLLVRQCDAHVYV